MPVYLKIPKKNKVPDTEEGLTSLFPDPVDLDAWQDIAYDIMVEQWKGAKQQGEVYDWESGVPSTHAGSVWEQKFRGKTILAEPEESDGNFCCGVTMEHWMMCHREWMEDMYEGPADLTKEQMFEQVRAHFFHYAPENPGRGAAGGVLALDKLLRKQWAYAKETQPGEDWGETFEECMGLSFHCHRDPYKARFGDYMAFGHATIFLGIEKRRKKNGTYGDAVRVFHSHKKNDYSMGTRKTPSGVGVGWFWIHPDRFWFGSIREIPEE